jgi:hypothetical protein
MSRTLHRCRRPLALLVSVLVLGLLVSPAGADERIAKADALLEKGKHAKARALFEAVDRDAGGRSPDALIGLVRTSNELAEHSRAYDAARRLLVLVPGGPARIWGAAELAHAVAVGGLPDRSGLEAAVSEVRAFLAAPPPVDFAKALRVRLCTARGSLGDDDPLGLGRGAIDPLTQRLVREVAVHVENPKPEVIVSGELGNNRVPVGGTDATLRGVIDRDGCMASVEILENQAPHRTDELLDWAHGYVYEPVILDGAVTPVLYVLLVRSITL